MAKRKSPTPDEIERINETLDTRDGFKIQDRDSYDLAFNDYMGLVKLDAEQKNFRTKAFNDYASTHPDISTDRIFTKAKGKDLRRDRLKTAKRIVTTRRAFIRGGARNLDLKGFDTARQRITKEQRVQRVFTIPARVKGRIVFAKRTSVKVRGKQLVRHRDSKGRFVSVKRR